MEKMKYLSINNTLRLDSNLSFEEFKKSELYVGQSDNRFFWIKDCCQLGEFTYQFKLGLCFRNNLIERVEIFCADEVITNEDLRLRIHDKIVKKIQEIYDIKMKGIENSMDVRNNYCSIVITF